MILNLSELSSEPLHAQMTRQIRALILNGQLKEGEALPSIRQLALLQRVSVITVKRSFQDLERAGLVHTKGTKGYFVASLARGSKTSLALENLETKASPLINQAFQDGLSRDQIQTCLLKLMKETEDHHG